MDEEKFKLNTEAVIGEVIGAFVEGDRVIATIRLDKTHPGYGELLEKSNRAVLIVDLTPGTSGEWYLEPKALKVFAERVVGQKVTCGQIGIE